MYFINELSYLFLLACALFNKDISSRLLTGFGSTAFPIAFCSNLVDMRICSLKNAPSDFCSCFWCFDTSPHAYTGTRSIAFTQL